MLRDFMRNGNFFFFFFFLGIGEGKVVVASEGRLEWEYVLHVLGVEHTSFWVYVLGVQNLNEFDFFFFFF